MKKIVVFLSILFMGMHTMAQTKYNPADYSKKPIWIAMMDDVHANYFEIQKAYDTYWENRERLEGESDMDIKQIEKNKKRFSKKELREARELAKMRIQVKKYNVWLRKMEPFVKEDGSIMTPEERIQQSN